MEDLPTQVKAEIATLRTEIDRVDNEILALLAHRRDLSQQIQTMRSERGHPRIDETREHAILEAMQAKWGGSENVWREILALCRADA